MKKIIYISIILTLLSFSTFAQEDKSTEKPKCPKIFINPPPVGSPDEPMKFLLFIDGNQDKKNFKIEWETEKGTIVSGQGTNSLNVIPKEIDKSTYYATVSVKVTSPNGCVVRANEEIALSVDRLPFIKDEFGNITNEDLKKKLDSFFIELQKDANATGLVVMFGNSTDLEKRVKIISDYIKSKNFQSSRITFIDGRKENEIRTEFWIIPAGADPSPLLIGKKPYEPDCPAISITPPPRALSSDEPYVFVANVSDEKDRDSLSYYWSVDKGEIIEGQGTKTIKISAKDLKDTNINVAVHISGLPEICLNEAYEAAIVTNDYAPILFDEFEKIKKEELEKITENFQSELNKDSSSTGYIINYGTPQQIAEREKAIRDFLRIHRYDATRIVFVMGGEEKEIRTRFWVVPLGADPSTIN